jgi:hypothetical protein
VKLLIIFLLPVMAFAQTPPKKASRIIVEGVSFDQVVNEILDKGWKIEKSDKAIGTIKTEKISLFKSDNGYLIINIRVKDSIATISGVCGFVGQTYGDNGNTEVANKGMKGSIIKESFSRMNDLALELSNRIKYTVNKP